MPYPAASPASPQALLSVCKITRFGYSVSSRIKLFCREKLIYASSITTSPSKLFRIISISCRLNAFPVGLLGEHIQMIFVCSSICFSIAARSSSKVFCKRSPANFHIMYMSTHFVHSIGRRMNDYIVFPGITKSPVKQIDAFITSVSQKYIFRRKAFDLRQLFFYFNLVRIGISVIAGVTGEPRLFSLASRKICAVPLNSSLAEA